MPKREMTQVQKDYLNSAQSGRDKMLGVATVKKQAVKELKPKMEYKKLKKKGC